MKPDIENKPIQQRFQHLLDVISSKRFIDKLGIGNEVPFFICPFKPEETVEMQILQQKLIIQLENKGIKVLDINLYDLSLDLLKQRNILGRILTEEKNLSKDQLKELLQGVLDPELELVKNIKEIMDSKYHDVLFVTGVGEVFPYIRSHNVLHNLQKVAKEKPTIMFFPGHYTYSEEAGSSLDLFGQLNDDRYYRAFNIYHYGI